MELTLTAGVEDVSAPSGVGEVLKTLFMNIVSNPIDAIANANYIGILSWAVLLGIALRKAGDGTKKAITDISDAISQCVRWIISCAPFGVMGLVFTTISEQGIDALLSYGHLILVLVGSMLFVALVVNPLITYIGIRKNPYPLVFKCLKDSGITAFFTRSSAANIPVNMNLCKELGLDKDTYSVSIPLGATINMGALPLRFYSGACSNSYAWNFCRFSNSNYSLCIIRSQCLWCIWCSRRFPASDPYGMLTFRYFQ